MNAVAMVWNKNGHSIHTHRLADPVLATYNETKSDEWPLVSTGASVPLKPVYSQFSRRQHET